jgi:uridine kinase
LTEAAATKTVAPDPRGPAQAAAPSDHPRWMTPTLRALFTSKIFWVALAVKLMMGSLLGSYYIRDLFVPFVNYFVESRFSNPWTHFAALGRLNSFPYPPVMLYVIAVPRLLFGWLLPSGTDTVTWAHLLVMRLPLLACDLAIAAILALWFPGRVKRILAYYWCSPLTLYVCYWHGQLDIIPTALFVAALYLLSRQRLTLAMVVLGLSLGAKTHLFVALPFLFLYLMQEIGASKAIRAGLIALATFALSLLPFVFSPAFRIMVFGSQEQGRLIALRLPVGPQMWLLVAPAAILLLWFRFLAYRDRNWDLLMLYLGILFSVFVLVAPPAPGYVLWSLPFLLHFLCRSRGKDAIPLITYGIAYLVFFWVRQGSDLFDAFRTTLPSIATLPGPYDRLLAINPALAQITESVSFTILQSSLIGVILFMYLVGVRRNDSHNALGNPVMIGVAGDSGSGKDRFVKSLVEVIGETRVAVVAGDDYHRWPRGHQMWSRFTHLDVKANYLHKQHQHAVLFATGQPVLKGSYDHTTGTTTEDELRDPNDVMIFQGLHSLSIDALRTMYDLSIFLDPEESLRYQWKIERDGRERGYTPEIVRQSLQQRQFDRENFILPQLHDAEIVVRWTRAPGSEESVSPGALRLEIVASNSFDFEDIASLLASVKTLKVQHEYRQGRQQVLALSGDIMAQKVAEVARASITDRYKYLSLSGFREGLEGCLQLVVSACLSHKITWSKDR